MITDFKIYENNDTIQELLNKINELFLQFDDRELNFPVIEGEFISEITEDRITISDGVSEIRDNGTHDIYPIKQQEKYLINLDVKELQEVYDLVNKKVEDKDVSFTILRMAVLNRRFDQIKYLIERGDDWFEKHGWVESFVDVIDNLEPEQLEEIKNSYPEKWSEYQRLLNMKKYKI